MPMTHAQRELIKLYSSQHGVSFSEAAPSSFTSTRQKTNSLTIQVNSIEQLENFSKYISALNKTSESKICTAAIGGGRGGANNSYCINQKITAGIDIFIQLTFKPTIEIDEKKSTCRITPNKMLIELSRDLHKAGYRCETLRGCLPVMSYGGGLATHCHSSVSFLAEIVVSIEMILPNGQKRTFKRGEPDFDLVSGPTLGLLGIITAIEIEVKPGAKNLKRYVSSTQFQQLGDYIRTAPSLEGHGIMFSSVGLTPNSQVKISRWDWVDDKADPKTSPQIVDDSLAGRYLIPFFVMNNPEIFSKIFNYMVISEKNTVISRPDKIMGPEFKVLGRITEIGLAFEYDSTKIEMVLQKLAELLEQERAKGEYPVNTSLFLRFPKQNGRYFVAVDFVSLGENLPGPRMLVSKIRKFLSQNNLTSHVHYGKSDAFQLQTSDDGWETLKEKFKDFYVRNGLDLRILNHRIRSFEEDRLKVSTGPSVFSQPSMTKSKSSAHEISKLTRSKL